MGTDAVVSESKSLVPFNLLCIVPEVNDRCGLLALQPIKLPFRTDFYNSGVQLALDPTHHILLRSFALVRNRIALDKEFQGRVSAHLVFLGDVGFGCRVDLCQPN